MALIFMNHLLRCPVNAAREKPKPVITVQRNGRRTRAHSVEIKDRAGNTLATVKWSPEGTPKIKSHVVRAWIEVEPGARLKLG